MNISNNQILKIPSWICKDLSHSDSSRHLSEVSSASSHVDTFHRKIFNHLISSSINLTHIPGRLATSPLDNSPPHSSTQPSTRPPTSLLVHPPPYSYTHRPHVNPPPQSSTHLPTHLPIAPLVKPPPHSSTHLPSRQSTSSIVHPSPHSSTYSPNRQAVLKIHTSRFFFSKFVT